MNILNQQMCEFPRVPRFDSEHQFLGLSRFDNEDFKVWLVLIGEDECRIAGNEDIETQLVAAFKEQFVNLIEDFTPAQNAKWMVRNVYLARANAAIAAQKHGCEFWQLVPHVPTESEFYAAHPAFELGFAPPMTETAKNTGGVTGLKKQDYLNQPDLFGGMA